jgi:hypothetical protein
MNNPLRTDGSARDSKQVSRKFGSNDLQLLTSITAIIIIMIIIIMQLF